MSESRTLRIQEFDINKISPNERNYTNKDAGGCKCVVIGKPGTGKTTVIKSIAYNKRNIIPCAIALSGTEDSNGSFGKYLPELFVYNSYREDVLEKFKARQKLARKHLDNPWAMCVIDDLGDTPSNFRKPLQLEYFKNGRHWKMLYILSLQYSIDIPPGIRTSIDYAFILREPNIKNRKNLFENYAGIVGDFGDFCAILDQITNDRTALVIDNTTNSNKIEDCVFWYNAAVNMPPESFRFGSDEYWDFNTTRINNELP